MSQDKKGIIKFAIIYNLVFLMIFSFNSWLLGASALILNFVYTYGILWVCLILLMGLLGLLGRFGFDEENTFASYVVFNTLISSVLLIVWTVFATYQISLIVAETKLWIKIIMYVLGFLSAHTCYAIVTTFYSGNIYKKIGLHVPLLLYILFAIWPGIPKVLIEVIL